MDQQKLMPMPSLIYTSYLFTHIVRLIGWLPLLVNLHSGVASITEMTRATLVHIYTNIQGSPLRAFQKQAFEKMGGAT